MSIQETVEVEKKTKYGTELIYPANDQAVKMCKALGDQKTFTKDDLANFKDMGFAFKQVIFTNDGKKIVVGDL